MQLLKRSCPHLFVLFFFYCLFDFIIPYLAVDEMTKKGLYVENVLFYAPFATFLCSFIYAALFGFSFRFSVLTSLLFLTTIVSYKEWIPLYQIIHFFLSICGNGLGHSLYYLRQKFLKKLEISAKRAIIFSRDKSFSPFFQESARLLQAHRRPDVILLY